MVGDDTLHWVILFMTLNQLSLILMMNMHQHSLVLLMILH